MALPALVLIGAILADTAGSEPPVDFDTEVVPVLTRAGCNAGACHGGAAGRGGFKLSLLAGDPEHDWRAIVRELEGRRVDLARPSESLLLRKPTGLVEHGGDIRLEPFGSDAALLERWVSEGARRLRVRRLEGFELSPAAVVVEAPGKRVRLRATASFDDGTRRDVTPWTVFTSNDPSAAEISDAVPGEVTVLRRGQSVIVARFLSRVEPARITTPFCAVEPQDASERESESESERASANVVDVRVERTLRRLGLTPAPPADDATFLRRARLALTGTLPRPEELRDFLADEALDKRPRLVDRLLDSTEFDDYWAHLLANLLRVRARPRDDVVARVYTDWLREQLAKRTPWDDVARRLITSLGDSHERGEAGYYRMSANARETAELTSEAFLGVRLRCANCHDHPLDRWTQDDYHGLAAIFARVERDRVVRLRHHGEVTHPRTGEPARARLPGERFLESAPAADGAAPDHRRALAAWLTSPENRDFARAMVNRLWKALMGRGLVEPVDDLRATNPATHPELLEQLADEFVSSGFDLRRVLRTIATSDAFGRAATPPVEVAAGLPEDDRFYSVTLRRPLSAEVLADAIADVTGVPEDYDGLPRGTRAIELPHPEVPSRALDLLGRCRREAACDSPSDGGGLAAELHLINGELVNAKLGAPSGRLAKLIAAGATDEAIVAELYARALGRSPRQDERVFWLAALDPGDGGRSEPQERRRALEDFLWSLLVCRECTTNH